MKSRTKRIFGAIAGLIYAAGYGFLCAMGTGGGHVNLTWFILFFWGYFGGLFFVLAGLLVVDLRKLLSQILLAVLLAMHFAMTIIFFASGGELMRDDLTKSWDRIPIAFAVLAALYFLPSLALTIILIKTFVERWANQKYR